jgi:hypothetical protein
MQQTICTGWQCSHHTSKVRNHLQQSCMQRIHCTLWTQVLTLPMPGPQQSWSTCIQVGGSIGLFSLITIMSCLLLAPVAILVEGTVFLPSTMKSLGVTNVPAMIKSATAAALTFHLYQQVSYMILARVTPVTHSIGNCLKRYASYVTLALGDNAAENAQCCCMMVSASCKWCCIHSCTWTSLITSIKSHQILMQLPFVMSSSAIA